MPIKIHTSWPIDGDYLLAAARPIRSQKYFSAAESSDQRNVTSGLRSFYPRAAPSRDQNVSRDSEFFNALLLGLRHLMRGWMQTRYAFLMLDQW